MKLKKFKKIAVAMGVVIIALLILTGCSQSSSSGKSGSDKQVTLRFSWWGNDDRHKDTLKAIKVFEKKNPNIKIKVEYSGWDGYVEKMATQISGGTEADILQMNYDWYKTYSPKGTGFVDLNKYKDIIDLSGWTKDQLGVGTINKKLNGIPQGENTYVFFVNKTILNKYGITDYPKTWDGWKAVAEKLPDGYYPVDTNSINEIICYLTQVTGKSLLDNDGKIQYSKDEIKNGYDWYLDLVKKGISPSKKWNMDTVGTSHISTVKEFIDGKIAGTFDWNGGIGSYAANLKENGMEMDIPSLPLAKNAKTDGAIKKPTMLFSISKNSKHPKEAAKFLNFILTESDGVKAMGVSRGMPINKAASTVLKKAGMIDELTQKAIDYGNNTTGVFESPYLEMEPVVQACKDVTNNLGVGNISSSEAATQLIEKVNAAVKQIKQNS